ncbi:MULTISPECIES: amidohydrolase family protein [unclassified Crossiella]|uniref:amidohydrolase family protein n=1 Tax=unclassified Crossiella TaxID=2620835 RepID=UPI001FFFE35C|nr:MULTISPECIES: amidohydrolase family protein [unclassified Crossiella]MCK2243607.1 amidohydrolase family protein [Crossiella sp. S99.2]MCK2257465.1 amidohydrolase family protein [Crossiella sp. S99.1]
MTESRKSPELAGPVASGSVFIFGANVVDVAEGKVLTGRNVLVDGDRITAVGRFDAPAGVTVLDARGRFLIPGLWDMHVHGFDEAYLPAFLGNGVTGVRQLAGAPVHADWRRRLAAGEVFGPRMVFGSRIIDGPRPSRPGSIAVTTPEDARAAVATCVGERAEFLKVYSQLPRDAYFALLAEAARAGIDVAGHVPFEVPVLAAAQRSIEHLDGVLVGASSEREELTAGFAGLDAGDPAGMFGRLSDLTHRAAETTDPARLAELRDSFLANGTWHVPTLAVHQAKATMGTPAFALQPYLPHIEPVLRQGWARAADWRSPDPARESRLFERYLQVTGELHRAGVPLLAGSDTFVPGFSLHDELELLVRAGLSPAAALRAATLDPARFLGVTDRFGAVAPGRIADLVVLEDNPLTSIANTRRVAAVLFGGTVLSSPAALAAAPADRPATR